MKVSFKLIALRAMRFVDRSGERLHVLFTPRLIMLFCMVLEDVGEGVRSRCNLKWGVSGVW